MIKELNQPICYSKQMPQNPTVDHIHKDFEIIMDYALSKGIIPAEDKYSILEKKYVKKIITKNQVDHIISFWNLEMSELSTYVGDVPYYNQLEMFDFIKKNSINPKSLLIVATPDTMYDEKSMHRKLVMLDEKIRERRHEFNMEMSRLDSMIKKDPIVLCRIEEDCYAVVSAWGKEEKALWNLPSLS